jgi:hypothetical protein
MVFNTGLRRLLIVGSIVGLIVGLPTVIALGAAQAMVSDLPAAAYPVATDDQTDAIPTILPTLLSLGTTGLPTLPTLTFYLQEINQEKSA